ncbi:MAG TPA: glutaredoxin family protein [Gammaproteobacteria bacterium]|nr:glutaredoxin family protein [Gammaproteobacteria bacterium]
MHTTKPSLSPAALPLWLCLGMLFYAVPAGAVIVVECIDAQGNSSFRESCPPGTAKKGEKKLPGKAGGVGEPQQVDVKEIAAKHPVLLYTAPKCDACDLVRTQLQKRGVPFTEKDASNDIKVQDELKALIGGTTLTVPVVSVDKDVLTGYNQGALDSALDKAGYPSKNGSAPKTAAEGGAPAPAGDTGTPPAPPADNGDTSGNNTAPPADATSPPADTTTPQQSGY